MRISDTITIRRGRAYEIKGTSQDGTMLLRPTKMVEMPKFRVVASELKRPAAKQFASVEVPEPIVHDVVIRLQDGVFLINPTDTHSFYDVEPGDDPHWIDTGDDDVRTDPISFLRDKTRSALRLDKGWRQNGHDSWKAHRNHQYRFH